MPSQTVLPDAPLALASPSEAREGIEARLEELAANLVLGQTDPLQWRSLLAEIKREAEGADLIDVAQAAAAAIDRLARSATSAESQPQCSAALNSIRSAMANAAHSAAVAGVIPQPPSQDAVQEPTISFAEDAELVTDFILESREHLAQVESQMMTLEKHPDDTEAINTVFRGFHTIKGLAGFLDLGDIQKVAHETETLLDLARTGKLRIESTVVDVVLAAADYLRVSLNHVEAALAGEDRGPLPGRDGLIERIRNEAQSVSGKQPRRPAAPDSPAAAEGTATAEDGNPVAIDHPAPSVVQPDPNWSGPERRVGDGDRRKHGSEIRAVKVETAKLDSLVDMVGELVIAQSMVRHQPELEALESPDVLRSLTHLARITGDLQKTAMSMRMVPIGGLFQRMVRLARDLARKTEKQVEIETAGGETELDRNVVEDLADPLMHMVRNAVDHGAEPAEERRLAGKDSTAHIQLRASHQAGHIVIEISDDGHGLIREKLLDKARRTGLVEDGSNLPDRDVFNFIFHPGFSTASTITDISGRGVGMDVVKKQIQNLRGHIDIESAPGRGTTFFLRLPLTLAMIDGLVVGVGSERYVVPLFSVREMLRPTSEMMSTVKGRHEVAVVRGNLLPVVRLYQRFGVKPRSESPTESLLIVAETSTQSFGLLVDELIGKQEVVIKSLGEGLESPPGVTGGAILGDGRVGLILDIEGIYRVADR